MGIIAETDIRGYSLDEQIVCPECITQEDQKDLKQSQIVTEDFLLKKDERYFCDRCKTEL